MLSAVLRRVDRFMAAHPWDHNRHYDRWLIKQAPTAKTALDAGCGGGDLARAIAARGFHVDAIDADPRIVEQAQATTSSAAPIDFRVGTLLDSVGTYDLITAVASLHHVDFREALRCLRGALAPGGALLVVGCYREATRADYSLGAIAISANMAVGMVKNLRRSAKPASSVAPRTAAPQMTLPEVRAVVRDELPGASLKRGLFWRYLLRYDERP